MKIKEKIVLFLIFLLFCASVFMFYYQNFYKPSLVEQNKVDILIAREDIGKNTELNEENVGWIRVDQGAVTVNNITKVEDAIGKKSSEKIFEGEFLNRNRIQSEDEEEYVFDTYTIDIAPDYATDLQNGDLIKVYVQTIEKTEDRQEEIKNFLVFDKKEIVEINKNEQTGEVINIKIRTTDKDSLSYYNAKAMGTVIALKYEADMNNSDYRIPVINIRD